MTSLARPHTDISMRPTNKEYEVLGLDDFFEHYIETDLLQFNDTTVEPSSSDDLAHLFEGPPSNGGDPIETSPRPDWDHSSYDAWHKALPMLGHNLASPTMRTKYSSVYPYCSGKASLSDPEFFHIDDLFELNPTEPRRSHSAPSSPKLAVARPGKTPYLTPDRPRTQKVQKLQKPTKKPNTLTRMMRSSNLRAGFHELWMPKLEGADAFNMQLSHTHLPHSPPSSTKIGGHDSANGFFSQDQPYTIGLSSPSIDETNDTQHSNYELTPLSSPAVDMNSRGSTTGNSFHFGTNHAASANALDHMSQTTLQTPPSSNRLPMTTWNADSTANLDFAFSSSPDVQALTSMSQGWWNSAQPSTPSYTSQTRSSSQGQTLGFGTNSVAGLGISCDTASFSGFGPDLSNSTHRQSTSHGLGISVSSYDVSFPQAPIYPTSPGGIHIGHPLTHSPPSRSPSHSPIPQPRFTRQRHSSHLNHHSHASRSHRTSSRKSSNSSTSHAGNHKSASVGFVNFTPDDSKKILTGVAPSGSSKTKARREKEAAEKRRKLSQAAVKAIIDAGGDISRLEEGGLLSLEVE